MAKAQREMAATPTYNFICFTELLNEYASSQKPVVEKKISRRLKYYKLDGYDAMRVGSMRTLKNDLATEITQFSKSTYYRKSEEEYAALADFDITRMVADYCKKYPAIDQPEMRAFIDLALYHFYLR